MVFFNLLYIIFDYNVACKQISVIHYPDFVYFVRWKDFNLNH